MQENFYNTNINNANINNANINNSNIEDLIVDNSKINKLLKIPIVDIKTFAVQIEGSIVQDSLSKILYISDGTKWLISSFGNQYHSSSFIYNFSQTVAGGTDLKQINLNTVVSNPSNMLLKNNTITINKSGRYLLNAYVHCLVSTPPLTEKAQELFIFVNGKMVAIQQLALISLTIVLNASKTLYLNEGDIVELKGRFTGINTILGGNIPDINTNTSLDITFVG